MLVKRWIRQESDSSLKETLSKELGVSPTTANILINRGITTKEEAERFIRVSLNDLVEPFLLPGMDRVVERTLRAIRQKEKILIYGDYDADGITATSLLVQFFGDIGVNAAYHIPRRLEEGYGMSVNAMNAIKEAGVQLIITVDCGISSVQEVEAANAMGMDVIITDHHEPPEILPSAYAIINPCLKGSTYPFLNLAGVGVAFKLAQAVSAGLAGRDNVGPGIEPSLMKYLDLVALGTIADVVPLKGENRILVKHGLELLQNPERVGLAKLKEVSTVRDGKVTAGTVGFQLAPRLNASGRLGRAEIGVRLLITDDVEEASAIAVELDIMNKERQKIEESILEEARYLINSEQVAGARSIVLASERWHQGVIGIVASKIVDEFFLPTVLISLNDETGKGSARSIPAFHLYDGLDSCSSLLLAFGGHKYAAGLSIKRELLPAFKLKFEEIACGSLRPEDLMPALRIDAQISLTDLNWQLYNEIAALAPFGSGNPEPVVECRGVEVRYPKIVGKNHVRMRLAQPGCVIGGIGFNMGGIYQSLAMGKVVLDAAFTIESNEWQGESNLQLNLKDIHF